MGAGVTRASRTTFSPQPDFVTGGEKEKKGAYCPDWGQPRAPSRSRPGIVGIPSPPALGGLSQRPGHSLRIHDGGVRRGFAELQKGERCNQTEEPAGFIPVVIILEGGGKNSG